MAIRSSHCIEISQNDSKCTSKTKKTCIKTSIKIYINTRPITTEVRDCQPMRTERTCVLLSRSEPARSTKFSLDCTYLAFDSTRDRLYEHTPSATLYQVMLSKNDDDHNDDDNSVNINVNINRPLSSRSYVKMLLVGCRVNSLYGRRRPAGLSSRSAVS